VRSLDHIHTLNILLSEARAWRHWRPSVSRLPSPGYCKKPVLNQDERLATNRGLAVPSRRHFWESVALAHKRLRYSKPSPSIISDLERTTKNYFLKLELHDSGVIFVTYNITALSNTTLRTLQWLICTYILLLLYCACAMSEWISIPLLLMERQHDSYTIQYVSASGCNKQSIGLCRAHKLENTNIGQIQLHDRIYNTWWFCTLSYTLLYFSTAAGMFFLS